MSLDTTQPTPSGVEKMILIDAGAEIAMHLGKARALVMRPDQCRTLLEKIALVAIAGVLDSREARAEETTHDSSHP